LKKLLFILAISLIDDLIIAVLLLAAYISK